MGGLPPIGYAKHERTLKVVAHEASFVRQIFALYLKLGTVPDLAAALDKQGARSPVRTFASGRQAGGGRFGRGQLYHLLNNPIYLGRIRHRDKTYPGQHEAIVDQATWEAVQAKLADNTQGTERRRAGRPSVLAGLVRDGDGNPLVASHACKGKMRYRYYVSRSVRNGRNPNVSDTRVPARELERAVTIKLVEALADPLDLAIRLGTPLEGLRMGGLEDAAQSLVARVGAHDRETLATLVTAVHVLSDEVKIDLDGAALAQALALRPPAETASLTLTSAVRISRTGAAMRMVFGDGHAVGNAEVKPALVKLLVRARGWWEQLASGQIDRETLARQAGVIPSYVSRVVRLAFLSPKLVDAILSDRHPASLDGGRLLAPGFPASWNEQERLFLRS